MTNLIKLYKVLKIIWILMMFKGTIFKKLQFKVYNNWGEVIFVSDAQSMGWDGKYNGVEQPVGVYVYTVEGTTENDKEIKVSGDVTLLR